MPSSVPPTLNDIRLEEEIEGGIVIPTDVSTLVGNEQSFDWKLCLIRRFIQVGSLDFPSMQQTLAGIWKPGKGVFFKEIDDNRFIFQFYHEIDIKRVIDGSPWYFNQKALIISRMIPDANPRSIPLDTVDLWVQVHDLPIGFMDSAVLRAVGDHIGKFVATCPKNLLGTWRNYMRVRVSLSLDTPLKRQMKIRQTKDDYFWVTFK